MQIVWKDLSYGARMLWKTPGFTLISVMTLALGIGANTAIFSVLYAVLLRPLPYHDPNRLVLIFGSGREDQREPVSLDDFAILKSQSLAPLMGVPVTLGKAENGAIVNQAALKLKRASIRPVIDAIGAAVPADAEAGG